MRKGIEVRLGPGDRERLEAVIGSGNSSQKACLASSVRYRESVVAAYISSRPSFGGKSR
jgi:hypothetical protein